MANQISTSVSILSSGLKGYQAVSLSALTTSSAPSILAGSAVEIASAWFYWATDEEPSGFSSITTATSCYIALAPSGSAGNQIVSAGYVADAPTWVDSKQGWYSSAGSSTRVIAHVYKTGTTAYDYKSVLRPFNNEVLAGVGTTEVKVYGSTGWHLKGVNPGIRLENTQVGGGTYDIFSGTDAGSRVLVIRDTVDERLRITTTGSVVLGYGLNTGGTSLITKVLEIGEWNMDGTISVGVGHDVTFTQIRAVDVHVINDAGDAILPIQYYSGIASAPSGFYNINATQILISRVANGAFDSADFDATSSTVANRGWVTVTYDAGT